MACLIVGSITAINNYKKELQFRKLQQKQDDSYVTLWRNGEVLQASVEEVCVGDVVQLDTGAKIPAGLTLYLSLVLSVGIFSNHFHSDGILIKCNELKVDESSLTGESMPVTKNAEAKPFMQSGCTVVEGDARYLVTAVGKNSEWGKILSELDTDRPDTPLQVVTGAMHRLGATSSCILRLTDRGQASAGQAGNRRPEHRQARAFGSGHMLCGANHHLVGCHGQRGAARAGLCRTGMP